MKLYHGSSVPGIRALRPALSNHGRPYVYLTDIEPLAAIYAHNPLPSPYGFFPYLWYQGKLHYEEYFHGPSGRFMKAKPGMCTPARGLPQPAENALGPPERAGGPGDKLPGHPGSV